MNNFTNNYLVEFYGGSARWFAIYLMSITFITFCSDLFFIVLALFSPALRNKVANWFLTGFSMSDALHSFVSFLGGLAIYLGMGSPENTQFCAISGFLVLSTVTSSLGFPVMIAADRYYKISALPTNNQKYSVFSKIIFADRGVIPMMVSWVAFCFAVNVPLLLIGATGEDGRVDICTAKTFTSVSLLLVYEATIMIPFFGGANLTALYYYPLAKWLQNNQSVSNRSSNKLTRSLMRLMKVVSILPIILRSPIANISALQMVLPHFPLWIGRAIALPN
jgi:hypothetical protein